MSAVSAVSALMGWESAPTRRARPMPEADWARPTGPGRWTVRSAQRCTRLPRPAPPRALPPTKWLRCATSDAPPISTGNDDELAARFTAFDAAPPEVLRPRAEHVPADRHPALTRRRRARRRTGPGPRYPQAGSAPGPALGPEPGASERVGLPVSWLLAGPGALRGMSHPNEPSRGGFEHLQPQDSYLPLRGGAVAMESHPLWTRDQDSAPPGSIDHERPACPAGACRRERAGLVPTPPNALGRTRGRGHARAGASAAGASGGGSRAASPRPARRPR